MCGIAGWSDFEGSDTGMKRALKLLSDRGPDYQAILKKQNTCFGHTRLSIIDTSSLSNQPFTVAGKDNMLVYNGEIFNYRELKKILKEEGVFFNTQSDTEVLYHLLDRHGLKALEKLNGFFAFAWYDGKSREVWLARDRFGIKPLYYSTAKGLIFSSELKGLIAMGLPLTLDTTSLELFLSLSYIPGPWSILSGASRLMPGHFIRYRQGEETSPVCYYNIPEKFRTTFNGTLSQAAVKVRDLLSLSVRRRMVADVPVGTFLSGGIDSAIISILAHREQRNIESFTAAFPDHPYFDESRYAAMVARKHGLRHHIIPMTGKDVEAAIHRTLEYNDEPFADSSAIAVNMLSSKVSQNIKVALSGDGADEIFGGYNKYRALLRAGQPSLTNLLLRNTGVLWKNLPGSRSGMISNTIRKAARYSAMASLSPAARYWMLATFTDTETVKALLTINDHEALHQRKQYLLRHITGKNLLQETLITDLMMVLPDDMLTKTDRMSMCHSLEVRVPFLDYELVEFAASLPVSYKMNRQYGKLVLRKSFHDLLPERILSRSKKGFEVPLAQWLRKYCAGMINEKLAAKSLTSLGLFNADYITRITTAFLRDGKDQHATLIWQLLVFQYWLEKHQNQG